MARTWRNGQVFLAGDAAHQTPPFVGQGLGSGLRDAFNLTWKLADVLDGAAPEVLLDTYESERKPHATRIILMALVVGWCLTGGQDRLASLRRALVTAACRIPRIAHALPDASPALSRGPLVQRRGFQSRLNGTVFPQPWVRTPDGARRLDDLLGTGYALITRGRLRDHTATRLAATGLTHIDVDDLACVPSTNPSPSAVMRSQHTYAVLLRPDRVVMASARTSGDVGDLLAAYQRVHRTDLQEIAV
ncbi:FAD-dependent monooxygenase [Williamsia sp. 1135]|uniref:FAD-dependent monooxygenase n=1 Tax=Williamsia sp. 1135 TaxID=1889262 RepID=UPI00117FC860|nr:FAD-dependent monooxygenase [Williamsia sp. 1135]